MKIKKHKTKIIAVFVILAALIGVWIWETPVPVNIPNSDLVPAAAVDALSVPKPNEAGEVYVTDNVSDMKNKQGEYDEKPESDGETKETESRVTYEDYSGIEKQENTEEIAIYEGVFTVTLSVSAQTILNNMHLLHADKHELVPEDGFIFPPKQVTAYEGESVFNVLQREMRRNRIHMASRFTPGFNSAYVEAINNLFEFDMGPLSGWVYSVNGRFPNFGSSRYLLSPGDVIEWLYTIDLGRDLGVYWVSEQKDD